jgi:membrane-bound metal-dependent hydrolase YbcI (DUF457 family)
MDTLSHGLWAIVLVKGLFKKVNLWLAFLFGVLPDVIPFGIPFMTMILSGAKPSGDPSSFHFPSYVQPLYSITHSLIIAVFVFLLIYLITKKAYVWMLGWPLHILVDIPTHSKEFFPTPLFYPISNFAVDGVNWGNPYIFFPNWILLITLLIFVFRKEIKMLFGKIKK